MTSTLYPEVEVGGGAARQTRSTPDHLLLQAPVADSAPARVADRLWHLFAIHQPIEDSRTIEIIGHAEYAAAISHPNLYLPR